MNLISICIPTYNGEAFIEQTLQSIKQQTYRNIELIISDDNSKDNTLQIIEKFKKEVEFPVNIFHHTPSGIGANWNNCLANANGDYIKFIFQDDLMEDTCLEYMLRCLMETNTKIAICKRKIIIDKHYKYNKSIEEWLSMYGDLQTQLQPLQALNGYSIITKSIFSNKRFLEKPYNKIGEPIVGLIHKSVYDSIGKYDENIKQFLDYEFWYRALLKYDFALINKALVSFRVHVNQTTKVNERNKIDELPLYLAFVNSTLRDYLDSAMYRKYFNFISVLKRKLKQYILNIKNTIHNYIYRFRE